MSGFSLNLQEKIVLITGASSGIGRGCAEAFAVQKSFLALTGRNADALSQTKKACIDLGVPENKVLTIVGDLVKVEDCERVVKETTDFFGKLDVFVHSAGCAVGGSIEDVSLEDYDRQMDVNTRSPFILTKLVLPHLLKTKGNIVYISSVTGLRAFPGMVAYNMSKAALDQLCRTVALEVASRGVRVNAVNPGVIITEIHKRAGLSEEQYAKFLEHSKTTHPLGHVGNVSEVANSVTFLASDLSSFTTGVTLAIDGGRSQMCPR